MRGEVSTGTPKDMRLKANKDKKKKGMASEPPPKGMARKPFPGAAPPFGSK